MPLLLAIETSTTVCSIALYKNSQLLGASELQIEKSHSSHITVMIEQLVQNCGASLQELEAIAVSGGPGSYTGLRIGVSTAKGLCYSMGIPLLQVSTLHGMAAQVIAVTPNPEEYLFCPMLDARRMEVYTCLLTHEQEEVRSISPVVLDEETFNAELQERPIIFFGSGAAKFRELKNKELHALFVEGVLPNAKTIGLLALPKYERQEFEDVAYYEPFYLKDVYITSATKSTVK